MTDYLSQLESKHVAAWYYRLANSIASRKIDGETPLSAVFLKHWLDNRISGSVFHFEAPNYLKNSPRFQLHSEVTLSGKQLPDNMVEIRFNSWRAKVVDTYDWNYDEYFTVPNPDFGSVDNNAVRPKDGSIRVYHKNAKRLEDARLAAPYRIESNYWFVAAHSLNKPEIVDPGKKLR